MIKGKSHELAIDISGRSTRRVKVGACITDRHGIVSWGWNHMGSTGLGCCAEQHAISRANPKRLKDSFIYVAGYHRKTGNPCPAKPCLDCQTLLRAKGIKWAIWQNKSDGWESMKL